MDQGSNLSHCSCDLGYSCSNTGSLTHYSRPGSNLHLCHDLGLFRDNSQSLTPCATAGTPRLPISLESSSWSVRSIFVNLRFSYHWMKLCRKGSREPLASIVGATAGLHLRIRFLASCSQALHLALGCSSLTPTCFPSLVLEFAEMFQRTLDVGSSFFKE